MPRRSRATFPRKADALVALFLRAVLSAWASYAPLELSRLIIRYSDDYGNLGLWAGLGIELMVIWTGWAIALGVIWTWHWRSGND